MHLVLDRPCGFIDEEAVVEKGVNETVIVPAGEYPVIRVPSPEGSPFDPWIEILGSRIGLPERLLDTNGRGHTTIYPDIHVTLIY